MIDCPVCEKKNISGPRCPQCETDLQPLIRLQEMPAEYYREGMDLLQKEHYDEAIESFISALSFDSGDVSISLALAKAYGQKGLYREALNHLRKFQASDPENQAIQSAIREIETKRDEVDALKEKEKRSFRMRGRLLVAFPLAAFLIGLAVVPLGQHITGRQQKTEADFIAGAEQIKKEISRYPDLAGGVKIGATGNGITVSGNVPTEVHKNLVVEISKHAAGTEAMDVHDLSVAPVQKPAFLYTVLPGENLSSIADKFYGEARMWRTIYQANKERIPSPNIVHAGMIVSIPNK